MENQIVCEEAEIEWDAIFQQLPDSPGICLDDFLLPATADEFSTDVFLPSIDRDDDGNTSEGASTVEPANASLGLQLSALSDILFNDEDYDNKSELSTEFFDMDSFLADSSTAQQQNVDVDNSADVDVSRNEGQVLLDGSGDVDVSRNEGEVLPDFYVDSSDDVDASRNAGQVQLNFHVDRSGDVDVSGTVGQVQQDLHDENNNEGLLHVDSSDDVHASQNEGQVQLDCHVDNRGDVDVSKNEVQMTPPEEAANGKMDSFSRKRKRNRESAVQSRERKKAYVKSLEAKCLYLEGKYRNLEYSLSYCSVENMALRHELIRVKRTEGSKAKAHCHGGRAEPAALLEDSLQKESLLCCLIMWVIMLSLFLREEKIMINVAVTKIAVLLVVVLGQGEIINDSVSCYYLEGSRRFKWSRKKMR